MTKTFPSKPTPVLTETHLSRARVRVVEAALELFARQGVKATSLQNIADSLGVTKAAVYHQFKTKEEIVLQAFGETLRRIAVVVEHAEAQDDAKEAAAVLIPEMVTFAVEKRSLFRTLQSDPELLRVLLSHDELRDLIARQENILLAGRDTPEARVRAALVASALGGAPANPLVAGLDDVTLATVLTAVARETLGVPSSEAPGASTEARSR